MWVHDLKGRSLTKKSDELCEVRNGGIVKGNMRTKGGYTEKGNNRICALEE